MGKHTLLALLFVLTPHGSSILSNGTFLLDGNWQIAQEPTNAWDIVNRAYVDAVLAMPQPLPELFNKSGCLHYARIENATFPLTADFSAWGWNSTTNGDFIRPCSIVQNLTVMAVIMGTVVDYFKPLNGRPCDMLQRGTNHLWSNNADTGFVLPSFDSNHLGGSAGGWPRAAGYDSRDYISFWGSTGSSAGGCCSYSTKVANTPTVGCAGSTYGGWCKSFDLWWR